MLVCPSATKQIAKGIKNTQPNHDITMKVLKDLFYVKGENGKELECAHPLVLNNGVPISWASTIMSVYKKSGTDSKSAPEWVIFSESVGALPFNGKGWANISPIQLDPFTWKPSIAIIPIWKPRWSNFMWNSRWIFEWKAFVPAVLPSFKIALIP